MTKHAKASGACSCGGREDRPGTSRRRKRLSRHRPSIWAMAAIRRPRRPRISVTDTDSRSSDRIVGGHRSGCMPQFPARSSAGSLGLFVTPEGLFYGGCTVKDGRSSRPISTPTTRCGSRSCPRWRAIVMPSGGCLGRRRRADHAAWPACSAKALFAAKGKQIRSVPCATRTSPLLNLSSGGPQGAPAHFSIR